MQKVKDLLQTILTIAIILGITTVLYLYSSGYRFYKDDDNSIDLTKTGMIGAKSIPEGATVYLDDEIVTATDDTISGVEPGLHKLRIVKKGFIEWEKEIEVFEELVTDITAVLVSQSPRLEPLTNTGAKIPSISPSLTRLAYFSKDEEKPGIWVIPVGGGLSLFRSTPSVVLEDTRFIQYSDGNNIEWSPDESELLVEGKDSIYYMVDLNTNTAETTSSPNLARTTWQEEIIEKREDFIEKIDLPEEIRSLATSSKTIWSPDDKKFLYTVQNGDQLEYKVYNLEDPIPVGENVETLVFTTNVGDPQPKLSWYSDSFHLVMVEGDIENNRNGVVSLIRIDGSNKTEIYNNTLYADLVYTAPGGDKVIIVTSFKSGDQTDLYTVSIR